MAIQEVDVSRPQTIVQQQQTLGEKFARAEKHSSLFGELLQTAVNQHGSPQLSGKALETASVLLNLDLMKSAISFGPSQMEPVSVTSQQNIHEILTFYAKSSQIIDTQPGNSYPDAPTQIAPVRPTPIMSPQITTTPTALESIIHKAANTYQLDKSLIKAVIKAESNFNPRAVSHAGAEGLMQLMPATAKGLGVTNSFNPEQNIMAGSRFLKGLLNRYRGDLDKALAAYNWGPGNVDKKGTTSLPRETRLYLVKVKEYMSSYAG